MGGSVIAGRYEIVPSDEAPSSLLGRGASGAVFEAVDRTTRRKVAIKRMNPDLDSPETRALVEREAVLLARVHHPGVVALLDSGNDAEGPFVVLELLEGETLATRLKSKKRLPPETVIALGEALSRALAAMHEVGLVHRDVKPGNIMLTPSPGGEQPKLFDLGTAHAKGQLTISRPGELVGTALYASPEQMKNEPVDGRADLYALGAVLYEALEGQRPFSGATFAQLVFAHVHNPPRPLSSEVPAGLAAVVLRCLEKDPAARWDSASALADAFQRLADAPAAAATFDGELALPPSPPVSAPSPSLPEPAPAPLELAGEVGPSTAKSGLLASPLCARCGATLPNAFDPCPTCSAALIQAPPEAPAQPLALRPLADPASSSPPTSPFFAILPARTYKRVGWGAGLLAVILYPVLPSPLWLLFCALVAGWATLGWYKQRGDGSLD